jgi:hypothetical protein
MIVFCALHVQMYAMERRGEALLLVGVLCAFYLLICTLVCVLCMHIDIVCMYVRRSRAHTFWMFIHCAQHVHMYAMERRGEALLLVGVLSAFYLLICTCVYFVPAHRRCMYVRTAQ